MVVSLAVKVVMPLAVNVVFALALGAVLALALEGNQSVTEMDVRMIHVETVGVRRSS